MNNRIDAIYARQSVDKKDSISIESQIEFCKYELKGGNCKEYTDKGYSGKNTDRPKFQELVRDIKRGLIAKVVVVKHFCNTLFENSPGISSFKWCFPIIVGMRTDMIVPYVHISV